VHTPEWRQLANSALQQLLDTALMIQLQDMHDFAFSAVKRTEMRLLTGEWARQVRQQQAQQAQQAQQTQQAQPQEELQEERRQEAAQVAWDVLSQPSVVVLMAVLGWHTQLQGQRTALRSLDIGRWVQREGRSHGLSTPCPRS